MNDDNATVCLGCGVLPGQRHPEDCHMEAMRRRISVARHSTAWVEPEHRLIFARDPFPDLLPLFDPPPVPWWRRVLRRIAARFA